MPLFLVIGIVAFASSTGTVSTLVTQRTGYVWHQKVIDVLRERISKKTSDVLEPEVSIFYDRRIFNPGTAWFGRVNFVVLTGSSVIILCAYLILSDPLLANLGFVLDGTIALIFALSAFVLSLQMLYHSVISHSLDPARKLFCQMQKNENPPKKSREIKHLQKYNQYLLITEIAFLGITLLLILLSILFIGSMIVSILLLIHC
ncbi:MAG: hypothetical protein P1Q69_10475 [Candidatus Thorarchaeota archaeon]|nr:hypothetical protein [Candidatus Thorarchaeota archaeon]